MLRIHGLCLCIGGQQLYEVGQACAQTTGGRADGRASGWAAFTWKLVGTSTFPEITSQENVRFLALFIYLSKRRCRRTEQGEIGASFQRVVLLLVGWWQRHCQRTLRFAYESPGLGKT